MAVMYAGRIAEEGPGARRSSPTPAHPYTRELLRSTISLETTELHSIPGAPPNLIDRRRAAASIPRCPTRWVCRELEPVEQHRPGTRVSAGCTARRRDPAGRQAPLERETIAVR
jgi:oligopeptide/dipeptide ABC transporter ATP-binding protein